MASFFTNWRTTLAGLVSLAAAGFAIYHDPSKITDPTTIGLITGGAGLIAAKDAMK